MNLATARIFDCFAHYDARIVMSPPLSTEWLASVRELDAKGAADIEYRAILSTGSKKPLRRGETWRARVMSHIADLQLRGN